MTTNNNDSKYSIGKIEAPNGSVQVGDHGNATTYNTGVENIQDAKKQLLAAIQSADIPNDSKEELSGAIESVTEEAAKEKPNKLSLTGMMGGITKAIGLIEKTQGLIDVYEKWKSFIGGDTPPTT